nr:cox cluster protein [Halomarina oriensis]
MTLYVAVVSIAGLMGALIAWFRPNPEELNPQLFGVIDLPSNALGMALYGSITLAVLFGVLLGAIIFVSNRYDDNAVGR